MVDGLGGDVLIKGLFVKRDVLDAEPGPRRRAALLAALSLPTASILAPGFQAWGDAEAQSDFDRATDSLRGHRAEEALSVLATRSARAIACSPFSLFGPELAVDVPFLAPAVLEAALAIDPRRKLDGEFYREVLAAASPAVASPPPSSLPPPPGSRRRARRRTRGAAAAGRAHARAVERARPLACENQHHLAAVSPPRGG